MSEIIVNLGYVMMFAGLLARDMLWLRVILVVGQSLICCYALLEQVWSVAAWNALFVLINAWRGTQVALERRQVAIPQQLQAIYQQCFTAFTAAEFLNFWYSGQTARHNDVLLLKEGEANAALYCLMTGELEVDVSGQDIAHLKPGSLVGEMSLLTGDPVTADVRCLGEVELHCWSASTLQALQSRKPQQWEKLKSAIGLDLVAKIKSASQQAAAVNGIDDQA